MLPLAQMIQKRDWDAAQAYVDWQSIGIIPEIRVIVNDPKTDSTTRDIAYGYLRRVRTLDSALLLAQGLGEGGRSNSVLGLIENPRAEVYPILKAKLSNGLRTSSRIWRLAISILATAQFSALRYWATRTVTSGLPMSWEQNGPLQKKLFFLFFTNTAPGVSPSSYRC